MSKTDNLRNNIRESRNKRRARLFDALKERIGENEILFKFNYNLDSENRTRLGVLAVTKEYIFSCHEAEDNEEKSPAVLTAYKIKDYKSFVARRNVGSVSLEGIGEDENDSVELCRSDMSLANLIIDASRSLNSMLDNLDDPDFKVTFSPDTRVCPKCHRPFKKGMTVCYYCADTGSMFKRLLKMVKKEIPMLLVAFSFFGLLSFVKVINPVLQKKMVDEYITITEPKDNLLLGLVVISFSIFLLQAFYKVIEIVRTNMLTRVSTSFMKKLRSEVFEKIQLMSVSSISKRTAGELIHRVTSDTSGIANFFVTYLPQFVENALIIVILGVAMFFYDWKLALLIMVPAPIIMMVVRKVWRFTHRLYHRQWYMESDSNTVLHDVFQGIRVVKVFGMEKKEIKRYDKAIKKVAEISEKNEITWALIVPYMNYLIGIGNYIVLAYVGNKILGNTMTLGDMSMFTFFTGQIYYAFDWLSRLPRHIISVLTSTRKVFEIMDEEIDVKDSEEAMEHDIEGNVEFKDVSFGYDEAEDVLKKISFSVKKGEMIGIVGRSGVGKSTLINLVMRLYDVRDGQILVDGIDVKSLSQHSLRSQIGVVLQETFLFSGTIYDNLSYADPEATREEIIKAAKMAGAHKFIMKLPDGYNTKVGERGHTLSGGERQRIAIARAILRDPKILILDEATSALDTETERLIQDSIASLIKDRTTFAIAHRLSTLRNATRLIVLDKGKIAETGTHEELMKKEGIYHSLVLAQRKMSSMSSSENGE
ncbi:MAG: ABC transporter ATP-binding protein [Clostridia bacterium]|nr:ABC transporter ATP-binding protein [Clostridia bacterium]